ncbi:hypothetical protein HDU83_008635 [Entophlyctis luteolus]|nr:hypothetical protein HDU83_008635 [Entophlyctis luteolus]
MDMSLDDIAAAESSSQRVYSNSGGAPYKRRGSSHRSFKEYSRTERRPYAKRPSSDLPWRHDKYTGPDADLRERIGRTHTSSESRGSGIASRLGAQTSTESRQSGSRANVHSSKFVQRSMGEALGMRSGSTFATSTTAARVSTAANAAADAVGALIRVYNLDPKASAADVQVSAKMNVAFVSLKKNSKATFTEFGEILKCSVAFEASNSSGTADIVFKDRASIKGAIDTYNGVLADGKASV